MVLANSNHEGKGDTMTMTTTTERTEHVEDVRTACAECRTVAKLKPVPVDEQEHKRLTQAKRIPTLHNMAKWLASGLPLEGEDFGQQVQTVERELLLLTKRSKSSLLALQTAYVFSRKVPRQERQDVFQELFLTLYQQKNERQRFSLCYRSCGLVQLVAVV